MNDGPKIEVTASAEDRARAALRWIEEIDALPLSLMDPRSMVNLLAWVADGKLRPFPTSLADERASRTVTAIQSGAPWTISSPNVTGF